ncbi:MAG: diadenylate cyclase CdaA [Aphanocapsa sp. GSE-SYN-MK-11-07L]|jgi:uncharacterized protein (TIGR00159 family)|nr:diadenylate cyclase CdaA [Aphanocapsa sp. GSE-SYN-MK-11-07L]
MAGLQQGLIYQNGTQGWLSAIEPSHLALLIRPLLGPFLLGLLDLTLVLGLTYMVLLVIAERRTLWMIRGFIFLMLATVGSQILRLNLLTFVLTNLVIGSAVALSVILQSEIRWFLEQLGRGQILVLLRPSQRLTLKTDNVVDEIVEAVKELSQNRTGALLILETSSLPMDERDFSVPGVKLNADVSKELIQTIFQTSTLLHDGALLIRGSRIVAASVILPLSERTASRQLGTRHRAAMGITERVETCACIVVSEETGSISLAEKGVLNRPLTSSKLKELLETRLLDSVESETETTGLRGLWRKVQAKIFTPGFRRLLRFPAFRKKT